MNKSYKMVVLRVLLDSGQMFSGVDLFEFAVQCRRFLQNHEVLRRDLEGERHAVDHQNADDRDWAKWWIKWPISRWLDAQNQDRWFVRAGDTFRFNIDCPEGLKPALERMTEELVDWRLAAYAKSRRLVKTEAGEIVFEGKVSHAGGHPILFLPDRVKQPQRPVGPIVALLPNGERWEFKLVKVACNVASPVGEKANQLGDLVRQWFGPNAGLPGTDFRVRFEFRNGQWNVSPCDVVAAPVSEPVERADHSEVLVEINVPRASQFTTHAPVYDLSAAAGNWGPEGIPSAVGWIAVDGQKLSKGMFAARVTGRSMEPRIPSGSWCLFRPCPAGSRQGRLLLVQVNTHTDPEDGGRYTVKRYRSTKRATEEGWEHETIELEPLNPDFAPIEIAAEDADDLRVVGEFVAVIAAAS